MRLVWQRQQSFLRKMVVAVVVGFLIFLHAVCLAVAVVAVLTVMLPRGQMAGMAAVGEVVALLE